MNHFNALYSIQDENDCQKLVYYYYYYYYFLTTLGSKDPKG